MCILNNEGVTIKWNALLFFLSLFSKSALKTYTDNSDTSDKGSRAGLAPVPCCYSYHESVLKGRKATKGPLLCCEQRPLFFQAEKDIYLRRRRAARPANARRESVAVVGSGIGAVA